MNSIFENLNFKKELKFLYLSFFLFACAFGINLVIFPTNLKLHGAGPALVGIASACETFWAIIASFFLAKIIAKFRLMHSLKFSAIFYALATILLYFYVNFWIWLLLISVIGSCWFIFAISRLSWLNILLENQNRGIGIGIFSMIISLGVGIGPLIVKVLGANSIFSFLASALLTLSSFWFLLPLKKLPKPQINPNSISLKTFFKNNPQCFLARFFLDFQSYSLMSFSVIYGVGLGYSFESSGLFITAYYASGFVDLIVGILLKNTKPQKLINIGFVGCLISFLMLLVYHDNYWFIVFIYFMFGSFTACIFVAVYKMMNEDYGKDILISAGSTFQLIGTSGAICGSIVGGLLGEFIGIQCFPIVAIIACVIYLSYFIFYEKKD